MTITKEKIKVDEVKCLKMAEIAQADLAQAMPALQAAVTALEALNKKDITEIKSYGQPPNLVRKVSQHFELSSYFETKCNAVLYFLGHGGCDDSAAGSAYMGRGKEAPW